MAKIITPEVERGIEVAVGCLHKESWHSPAVALKNALRDAPEAETLTAGFPEGWTWKKMSIENAPPGSLVLWSEANKEGVIAPACQAGWLADRFILIPPQPPAPPTPKVKTCRELVSTRERLVREYYGRDFTQSIYRDPVLDLADRLDAQQSAIDALTRRMEDK